MSTQKYLRWLKAGQLVAVFGLIRGAVSVVGGILIPFNGLAVGDGMGFISLALIVLYLIGDIKNMMKKPH